MLTSRSVLRAVAARRLTPSSSARWLSTKAPATKEKVEEEVTLPPALDRNLSSIGKNMARIRKSDKYQISGPIGEDWMPAPPLPEEPAELALVDAADVDHRRHKDGTVRTVVIRQEDVNPRQAPLNPESTWRIAMYEDGIMAEETWTNPLMGWTSSSDPYQCEVPLTFTNALDAVDFAKKQGWDYVVTEPVRREQRQDEATYQDNFLPQAVAKQVKMEGSACKQWERKSAGTSHYFRPLKYHGDGTVRQHGLDREAPTAKAPEGYYKLR
uniref:NADH dehydrogenase [ubiquinone] iron-sulfur protein 4, mitochondrial n=1 Tax=Entomoneis paludosa TaxID=265537 RepID=A0A7S2V6R9_9STRA|mmetsp:Transcript_10055/g.20780  ORF Transcript_10055/g.20780 Transcript_10055/m.20780 type:complete len:269 (+) Transcript_10055:107-913(+)